MGEFKEYLDKIRESLWRDRMEEIFNEVRENYPQLEKVIKWNQPMFTDHGTFVIPFSHSKRHIVMSEEVKPLKFLKMRLKRVG
ncbi:iron chaperone [Aerococcaceae bacterium WGS1372]